MNFLVKPNVCFFLFALVLTTASDLSAAPTLSYAVPAGAPRGQTVDVTFHGGGLAGVTGTWSSIGAKIEVTKADDGSVSCRLTIPPQAPPGIGAIRVATHEGVSNPLLFIVDSLPVVADQTEAISADAAQPITPPVAIDGAVSPQSSDFFVLEVAENQKLSFEVLASRLGSPLDPVVRLLDENRREIAFTDDEPGLGADGRFAHLFEKAGRYLLEIRDVSYRGGADRRYRLRVGDFPLVTVPFPLGAAAGSTTEVSFAGPDVDGVAPARLVLPSPFAQDVVTLGVERSANGPMGFVRLATSNSPELIETEPNGEVDSASTIDTPVVINGRFDEPKDRDLYRFEGKKGEQLRFVGVTRQLGAPTDLFLRVLKKDGSPLAQVDDSGDEEGSLDFTLPEDGEYFLAVEDLHYRGGPELVYRVEVERSPVTIDLRLEVDRITVPYRGVLSFLVKCTRRGYGGPVRLTFEGLTPKVDPGDVTIAAGKNDTRVVLPFPSSVERGELSVVTVRGTAVDAKPPFTVVARATNALRKAYPRQDYPPPGLDSALALGVGAPFPDFFKLSLEEGALVYARYLGVAEFQLKCERLTKEFKGAISISVEGLPGGITAELGPTNNEKKGQPPVIPNDKNDAPIVLRGPGNPPSGEFKVTIRGRATFQDQPKEYVLAGVPVRVVAPVSLTVAPAGVLSAGATQKIKVTARRLGAEKGVVTLSFAGLPAGVTAPEKVEIPADKEEVEVELKASSGVASGLFGALTISGTTKLGEKEVTFASAPFALELKS